ncbi:NUC153 domain containing protein [Nitzschia inconspicua]|uniref:NUC153 domain containing protein n=1 Tax=Nitzschia inconspicua TaxID=303405 RepID=A0A9K3PJ61_9STRA|nr:NUC153 domain containing protein [Nitzschia inconspicua]
MGKKTNKKSKTTKSANTKNDATVADPTKHQSSLEERFAAAESRPQFRPPKPSSNKVVLDERFSSVLTDPRFQLQEKDKYGRKKKKKEREATAKEELKEFYVVQKNHDDDDDDDDDKNIDKQVNDKAEKEQTALPNDDSSQSSSSSTETGREKAEDPASRIAYLTALSRGELDVSSSSDEDDSSQSSGEDDEEEEQGEDPVYGTVGVLDPSFRQDEEEVEISYDPSPYLVVTNMDWENIRAEDLFAVLSSFAPPGACKKVQVYQSDFGMERMEKDKLYGPTGIWKKKEVNRNHQDSEENENSGVSEVAEKIDDSGSDRSDDEEEVSIESTIKLQVEDVEESDFDPEKLRAYEASKLKYYFAIVQFAQPEHADLVYQEVDGMEFERSSAAMDLRTIPPQEVPNVTTDRPLRDEATSIPGNYQPPEFVVSALQQTNVQCTWDQGDTERERKLTKYASAGWRDEYEHDDLKAYLASDPSSDEDSDDEDKVAKASKMRKLLGLDSDDGEDDSDQDDDSNDRSDSSSNGEEGVIATGEAMSKEIKYVPGRKDLEEKIRSKLASDKDEPKELTPWEKYQEKRKQKRKERRQATRGHKKVDGSDDSDGEDNRDKNRRERDEKKNRNFRKGDDDDFFMDDDGEGGESIGEAPNTEKKAREELELLLAGEREEEQARDYDIRGIERMERNKGKKLKGSRKRKEAKVAADVSGTDFKVNVHDDRFKAVLDGSDDRFGIDKTDPNFKDTSAMREILSEQSKRRKKKRKLSSSDQPSKIVPDVNSESTGKTSGASALSTLVQRLKSRVTN